MKFALLQLPSKRRDYLRSGDKCLAHVRIGDQIEIALPVAGLDIFQAVPLLGHCQQDLRKEVELFCVDAQLAGSRAKKISFDSDDIA